jgi:hypothetical protein
MNAPVLVPTDGETDPLAIAMKELAAKKIPLVVRRYLPDGSFEVSEVSRSEIAGELLGLSQVLWLHEKKDACQVQRAAEPIYRAPLRMACAPCRRSAADHVSLLRTGPSRS